MRENQTFPLIEQGCTVTAHYNSNRKSIDAYLDSHSTFRDRTHALQSDLTKEISVSEMFKSLSSPVSVLVVNHGVWPVEDVPLMSMTLDQWEGTLSTNLTSSFLVIRSFLKELSNAPPDAQAIASIVMIGSSAGRFGEANHADYAASKSGQNICSTHSFYLYLCSNQR